MVGDITTMPQTDLAFKQVDFSIASGGLTFEFFRLIRLAGDESRIVRLRVAAVVIFAWLPLLLLCLRSGTFYNESLQISFLTSITGHVRFLIVLPILIAVEPYVQRQLNYAINLFLIRNIIPADQIDNFKASIDNAHRIRNSYLLEIGLLVLVYTVGIWFWGSRMTADTSTWFADPDPSGMNLTPAGYWLVIVSLPIFQFFLVRWYARFFILFRLLLQISKLNLILTPTHPDHAGGLGFLGRVTYALAPLLFAQGALLSAMIAGEVIQQGRELSSFTIEIVGYISFFVIAVLLPLTVFVPDMFRAKRLGLGLYGTLASEYVTKFDKKWIFGYKEASEELLGTGDIQSLADLGNSYSVIREMNLAPFFYRDIVRLAAITASPLIPLLFLVFSPEELFKKIVEALL